ncbi:MAG: mechanosensitive ion channel family protein [Bacteroidia bacterium]|nr:mechanosensitive ion channel family protein [Bacteroidia bacterium]
MDWLISDIEYYDNKIKDLILFAVILIAGLLFKRYIARVLSKQSFRIFKSFSKDQFGDEFLALLRKPIEQFITIIVIYFAFEKLNFPSSWNLISIDKIGIRWLLFAAWQIWFIVVICKILLRTTDFFTHVLINRESFPITPELGNFVKELIKVLIVILCLFIGLRIVFHVNITALVASLGIGGLAVALAAQDTLANLLGSFIIYLDKPFKAGDLIEAGNIKGRIERVGFRSTRIRTIEKSLLTVPNKKLIDDALNNITLSEARRVMFELGLTYSSTSAQILQIINDINLIIKSHELISDDCTVRFTDFSTSSLNILVIYFVKSNDFDVMIRVKEEINIQIMGIIEKHGCDFAFPTQTLFVNKYN